MFEQHRAAPLSARERAVLRRIEAELWPESTDASPPGSDPGTLPGRPAWAFQLLGVVSTTFAAVMLGALAATTGNWRPIAMELGLVSLAFAVGLVLTLDPLRRRAGSIVASVGRRVGGRVRGRFGAGGGGRSRRGDPTATSTG